MGQAASSSGQPETHNLAMSSRNDGALILESPNTRAAAAGVASSGVAGIVSSAAENNNRAGPVVESAAGHGASPPETPKSPAGSEKASERSKEPRYSRFTQQELPACRPLLTPGRVVVVLVVIGTIFIPIGIAALVASTSVVEIKQRYDHLCAGPVASTTKNSDRQQALWDAGTEGTACTLTLKVNEKLDAPVFVYYELTNFYQNHRRISKSLSSTQLRGGDVLEENECEPALYIDNNKTLTNKEEVLPCGLRAATYFNDSYALQVGGSPVAVSDKGIAFKTDVDTKYTSKEAKHFNTVPQFRMGGTINGSIKEDERFVIWMRTAALPTFRKLWGKIDRSFNKGEEITVQVNNRYNSYGYGGEKAIVLSTSSWLGGKNPFLGLAYIVVGAFCYVAAGAFVVLFVSQRREFGDLNRLSWVAAKGAQG
ncbi:ALA-interacting subunit [Pseudoscourfieldia marina]